jgi:hypothetical protein
VLPLLLPLLLLLLLLLLLRLPLPLLSERLLLLPPVWLLLLRSRRSR